MAKGRILMRINNESATRRLAGFSRTDLIVIVAVVTAVIAVVLFGVGFGKEAQRRAQCRANLRQIGHALQLYAEDYRGMLPDCTANNPEFHGAVWPWDMHVNLVQQLENRGAKRIVFYCPSNPEMNDDHHWDFPKYSGGQTRVLGYIFLLKGVRDVPPQLARVKLDGSGTGKPDSLELSADATVNQGGDYVHIKGLWVDRSNHVSGQKPTGGDILFEDGHAAWRPFSEMKHQIVAQVVWDF